MSRTLATKAIVGALLAAALAYANTGRLSAQESAGRGRVLVLGFSSQYINEVQDMLLRESVMRNFRGRGYVPVPVMEVEDYVQENGLNVRAVNRASMKSLCEAFNADYSLSGSIEVRRRRLFVSLSLYQKNGDQYYSFIIPMGRNSEFQRYSPGLARDIANKADVIIRGNLK